MAEIQNIHTRAALVALARDLHVRPDWHEPDEVDVTATVVGLDFDNALTNARYTEPRMKASPIEPLTVVLHKDGKPVAEVNVALLLAWATGYEAEQTSLEARVRHRMKDGARLIDDLASRLRLMASDVRDLADD